MPHLDGQRVQARDANPVLEQIRHLPAFWHVGGGAGDRARAEKRAGGGRRARLRGQMDVYLEAPGAKLPCAICGVLAPRPSERDEQV